MAKKAVSKQSGNPGSKRNIHLGWYPQNVLLDKNSKKGHIGTQVLLFRHIHALCAQSSRTVGESRLEGEDSRSRGARASARHRSVQDERVAIRSSNGGISRQGTQSKGRAGGSHWRRS